MIQALVKGLYNNPQGHELLMGAFLLLGQDADANLASVLSDANAASITASATCGPSACGRMPRTPLAPAKTIHDFVPCTCDQHHYH